MKRNRPWMATWTLLVLFGAIGLAPALVFGGQGNAEFTQDFFIEDCTFSTTGTNPFFILERGAWLVLGGFEDKEEVEVTITVLNDTMSIHYGGRTIQTRVVEEYETKDGEVAEVSWNYFAICRETNSVFYFGEDVDNYEDGVVVNHDGSWLAGVDGAHPGIIMPGTILLGSRYYQEIAPDVAMDRAEHVAMNEEIDTEVGTFEGCLKVEETTPLEPNARDEKGYCPGIGLVKDGSLVLIDYSGF